MNFSLSLEPNNPEKPCSSELFRCRFRLACRNLSEHPPGWAFMPEKAEGEGPLWVSATGNDGQWAKPLPAENITEEEGCKYVYCRSLEKPETPPYINARSRHNSVLKSLIFGISREIHTKNI